MRGKKTIVVYFSCRLSFLCLFDLFFPTFFSSTHYQFRIISTGLPLRAHTTCSLLVPRTFPPVRWTVPVAFARPVSVAHLAYTQYSHYSLGDYTVRVWSTRPSWLSVTKQEKSPPSFFDFFNFFCFLFCLLYLASAGRV